jgi:hypothetical protein
VRAWLGTARRVFVQHHALGESSGHNHAPASTSRQRFGLWSGQNYRSPHPVVTPQQRFDPRWWSYPTRFQHLSAICRVDSHDFASTTHAFSRCTHDAAETLHGFNRSTHVLIDRTQTSQNHTRFHRFHARCDGSHTDLPRPHAVSPIPCTFLIHRRIDSLKPCLILTKRCDGTTIPGLSLNHGTVASP